MITIEAIYEDGVLKPTQPLPLREHETVRIIVQAVDQPTPTDLEEARCIVRRSQGLIGWTGDIETLRRLAESPEFDPQES